MTSPAASQVDISVITDAADIPPAFEIVWACYGEQVPNAVLEAFNPRWDTPEGYAYAVKCMTGAFENATNRDTCGNPTSLFTKATITDVSGRSRIVGLASWIVLSLVEGYGAPPLLHGREALDVEELYPDDPLEQQYVATLFENLHAGRHKLVQLESSATPPAIMCLDQCVVHPQFQRRGIGSKLVQYGLDEAKRRGGMVCCTEASMMGKPVYEKLGFRQQGSAIDYGTDGAKFAKNGMPPFLFMRTDNAKQG